MTTAPENHTKNLATGGTAASPSAKPGKNLALIQLISDEAMPNLLPIMALKPVRLIHLCSKAMGERSGDILRAAKAAGWKGQHRIEHLSIMPEAQEVNRLVRTLVSECNVDGFVPLINFTGGTKLMSIGAYAAALQEQASSVYVDTGQGRFHDGHTGAALTGFFPDGDLSFSTIQRSLRVDFIAAANGGGRVTGGENWNEYRTLAEYLLRNTDDEENCHNTVTQFKRSVNWRSRSERLTLLGNPLSLPDPVGQLAVECGLLREVREGYLCAVEQTSDRRATGRHLEFILNFLEGAWWEVAVINAAEVAGVFRDLRWSVHAGARGNTTDMEEDILGVCGVQLLYISCKRTGKQLSRLLDEIAAGAQRVGGRFHRAVLAVCYPPAAQHLKNLRQRAQRLRIEIITGDDVRDRHCFGKGA